jgi:hypothetical protein
VQPARLLERTQIAEVPADAVEGDGVGDLHPADQDSGIAVARQRVRLLLEQHRRVADVVTGAKVQPRRLAAGNLDRRRDKLGGLAGPFEPTPWFRLEVDMDEHAGAIVDLAKRRNQRRQAVACLPHRRFILERGTPPDGKRGHARGGRARGDQSRQQVRKSAGELRSPRIRPVRLVHRVLDDASVEVAVGKPVQARDRKALRGESLANLLRGARGLDVLRRLGGEPQADGQRTRAADPFPHLRPGLEDR